MDFIAALAPPALQLQSSTVCERASDSVRVNRWRETPAIVEQTKPYHAVSQLARNYLANRLSLVASL